jgi:hypothetical protein
MIQPETAQQFTIFVPTDRMTDQARHSWEWHLMDKFGGFWIRNSSGTFFRNGVRCNRALTLYDLGVLDESSNPIVLAAEYAARLFNEPAITICDGVFLHNVTGDLTMFGPYTVPHNPPKYRACYFDALGRPVGEYHGGSHLECENHTLGVPYARRVVQVQAHGDTHWKSL